ncbi:hypothetical protein P7C73_g273, partial [Tremellales sp. Uapishka_1]
MPISTQPPTDEHPSGPHPDNQFPELEHFRVPNIPPAAYYIPDFITEEEEVYILRKKALSRNGNRSAAVDGELVDSFLRSILIAETGSGRLQYWGGTLSKSGVLLPEALPSFLTTFPDIIERIESMLDMAGTEKRSAIVKGKERALGINQVLVNEYQPGQGISPHEDGGAFRPLVATVSLGSHTVLDIHHYLSPTSPSPPMTASASTSLEGKSIAAIPLAHLLLLPRSLLILTSSLYSSHLHGITPLVNDVISRDPGSEPNGGRIVIANKDQLGDADILDRLRDEGRWEQERSTRTSLTFRRAEKVFRGGAALGGLRRG